MVELNSVAIGPEKIKKAKEFQIGRKMRSNFWLQCFVWSAAWATMLLIGVIHQSPGIWKIISLPFSYNSPPKLLCHKYAKFGNTPPPPGSESDRNFSSGETEHRLKNAAARSTMCRSIRWQPAIWCNCELFAKMYDPILRLTFAV